MTDQSAPEGPVAKVPCPECNGAKTVWADYSGGWVEADCPYCGGSGTARRGAVLRDYPELAASLSDQSAPKDKQ